jgi:hypothetical protein
MPMQAMKYFSMFLNFLALGGTFSINVILDVFCLLPFVSAENFSFEYPLWEKNLKVSRDWSSLLHVQVIQSIAKKQGIWLTLSSLQTNKVSDRLSSCYVTRITLRLCAHNNKYYVHNLIFDPGFLVVLLGLPFGMPGRCVPSCHQRIETSS